MKDELREAVKEVKQAMREKGVKVSNVPLEEIIKAARELMREKEHGATK